MTFPHGFLSFGWSYLIHDSHKVLELKDSIYFNDSYRFELELKFTP